MQQIHNNFLGRVLAEWLSDYPFIDALFVTNVAAFNTNPLPTFETN
jgi:hypothetical protein